MKSILKSSGSKFKVLREKHGDDVKHYDVVATSKNQQKVSYDQAKLKTLLGTLGTFDAATQTPDDLKKITGVGPVLEEEIKCYWIIYFSADSKMTNTEYDLLDEILGEFPGRAKRDDWAGQASKLKNN